VRQNWGGSERGCQTSASAKEEYKSKDQQDFVFLLSGHPPRGS